MTDRPDAPQGVRVVSCTPTVAEVAWLPAVPHNDPILEYSVFYNMTFFGTERDAGPRGSSGPCRRDPGPRGSSGPFWRVPSVGGNRLLVRVKLVPGSEYTFHVRARNALGWSERSAFSTPVCHTPSTIPFRNPAAVCTESRQPDQLVITWQVRSPSRISQLFLALLKIS